MNYKMIGRIISEILAGEAIFVIPALIISLADGDGVPATAFIISMGIMLAAAGILFFLCKNAKNTLGPKDSFVCVGLVWIFLSLTGCLPFYISGEIPNFIDALFETVSGFTTTGASVVPNVEVLSRGILYWRSFSHWLGGMGILVLLLAVTPSINKNGGSALNLMKSESPGPDVGKIVPKMKQTAKILYLLYIVLTIVDFMFLKFGGMPWFDSVCTALGTAGTGGFGIKADSIGSYSPYIQNVCTVFMLLFGVNFTVYYLLITKKFKNAFKNEELWLYIGMFVVSTALISVNVRDYFTTSGETVRHAAFQTASIMSSTGFCTVDFDLWPSFSKGILLCLMMSGACAGSTGGGLKCSRVIILFKSLKRNIEQLLRPQKIQTIHIDGQIIDEKVVSNTNIYLTAYMILMILSFLIVSIDGFSVSTNISAVVSCFNNMGPGYDSAGPMLGFGAFSPVSKAVLIFDMLAGRLEIMPILVLCSMKAWKK